jgi:hypothetical protein
VEAAIRSHRLRAQSHEFAAHFRCQWFSPILLTDLPAAYQGSQNTLLEFDYFPKVAYKTQGNTLTDLLDNIAECTNEQSDGRDS